MKINIGTNEVDSNSIIAIGEYTTAGGPFFDDHFIVFILSSGLTIEITTPAAQEALAILSKAGIEISHGLCNVTDCASRIMLPKALLDRPLHDFRPTLWNFRKLKNLIFWFGATETELHLTKEMQDYIKNNPKPLLEC